MEDQVRDDAKQVRWRVQMLFYKFLWWSVRLQRYLLGLTVVSLCLMSCDELSFHFSLKMFLTGDFLLALKLSFRILVLNLMFLELRKIPVISYAV